MENKYKVIKAHVSNYPQPIQLSVGQRVILGKLDDGPEGWRNWRYCYTLDKKMEGWVPEQIIEQIDTEGIITETYSANELNVNEDDVVVMFKELNGWGWCQAASKDELGWIPLENLQRLY